MTNAEKNEIMEAIKYIVQPTLLPNRIAEVDILLTAIIPVIEKIEARYYKEVSKPETLWSLCRHFWIRS